jgi:hypothetical protein
MTVISDAALKIRSVSAVTVGLSVICLVPTETVLPTQTTADDKTIGPSWSLLLAQLAGGRNVLGGAVARLRDHIVAITAGVGDLVIRDASA